MLIEYGETRVICNASVEKRVPRFLKGSGSGWITAEYGMLPRSTHERMGREAARGRQGGRTLEIQRLIGRSLRAAIDLKALGERTVTIDCDVIQADGGTRTASVTGGFVALSLAMNQLLLTKKITSNPIHGQIAAVSVGVYKGVPVFDLDYKEDSDAETDMNVVMNDAGAYIELQGTAEGHAFRKDELGNHALVGVQRNWRVAGKTAIRVGIVTEKIVLASGNAAKIREIDAILDERVIVPQSAFNVPEAEEIGLTFVENAILKARNACCFSGLPAIADDSGIEVDALGGAPGVISARYAGENATDRDNLEKLLEELVDVPDSKRSARFHCVLVYMSTETDPSPIIAQGVWEGAILHQPIGAHGFGYDPIFFVPEKNCSSAQLEPDIKNQLSHRAKALKVLMEKFSGARRNWPPRES